MAKKRQKRQRVVFKDGLGRYVKAEDRYKQATTVQVLRRGRYVTVIERGTVTPTKLAQVTNRTEFESLPPAFQHIKKVTPDKPKRRRKGKAGDNDVAWQLANKITATRGIRDKMVRITVSVKKGKRKFKVAFFHKLPSKKKNTYALFKHIREASGGKELPFWYDIQDDDLGDLLEDDVDIEDASVEVVM